MFCLASWQRDTGAAHSHLLSPTVLDGSVCPFALVCCCQHIHTPSHGPPSRHLKKVKVLWRYRTNNYWETSRVYCLLFFAQQQSIDFCSAFQNIAKMISSGESLGLSGTCFYTEMWTHCCLMEEDLKKTWNFPQKSDLSVFILNE